MIHPGIGKMLVREVKDDALLIMPDNARRSSVTPYEVVAIGPILNQDASAHTPIVEPGDVVFFPPSSFGYKFKYRKTEYHLCEYADIAAFEKAADPPVNQNLS